MAIKVMLCLAFWAHELQKFQFIRDSDDYVLLADSDELSNDLFILNHMLEKFRAYHSIKRIIWKRKRKNISTQKMTAWNMLFCCFYSSIRYVQPIEGCIRICVLFSNSIKEVSFSASYINKRSERRRKLVYNVFSKRN